MQFLPEYRLRVLAGLRQHFRARRAEGLLSTMSFRWLDQCCKEEIHSGLHAPLDMWQAVEKAGVKHWTVAVSC